MVFLTMLAIAFGTATVLLCLVIGILEAPWPVLVGVLVLGLLATRISTEGHTLHRDAVTFRNHANRHSRKHSAQNLAAHAEGHSKLQPSSVTTYRGTVYQRGEASSKAAQDADDETIAQGLIYRGVPYGDASHSDYPTRPAAAEGSLQDPSKSPIDLSRSPSSELAQSLSSEQAKSTEVTPSPAHITIVEGTYRGRHWERAIASPTPAERSNDASVPHVNPAPDRSSDRNPPHLESG